MIVDNGNSNEGGCNFLPQGTQQLTCPSGYTMQGTTCIPPLVQPPDYPATQELTCPSGGALQGATPATPNYSCPNGGTYNASTGMCHPPAQQEPNSSATPICPTGFYMSSSGVCQPDPAEWETYGMGLGPDDIDDWMSYGLFSTGSCYINGQYKGEYTIVYPNYNGGGGCIDSGDGTCGGGLFLDGPCANPPPVSYQCPAGYTISGSTCIPPVTQPPDYPASNNPTCPAGSTLQGTQCVLPQGATCQLPPLPVDTNIICQNGGALEGVAGGNINYKCGEDATFSQSIQMCVPNYVPVETTGTCDPNWHFAGTGVGGTGGLACFPDPSQLVFKYTTFEYCPLDGGEYEIDVYSLPNGSEYIIWTNNNNGFGACLNLGKEPTLTCPVGYTRSGTTCIPPTVPPYPPEKEVTCPSGYTVSGDYCIAPEGAQCALPPSQPISTPSCPATYTFSSGQCIAPLTTATETFSCSQGGTHQGNQCVFDPLPATENLACDPGETLVNRQCIPDKVDATKNLTCPTGGTIQGTQCVIPPVPATENLACNPGESLSNRQCISPSYPANQNLSCDPGTTISGTQCIPDKTPATPNYTCPAGGTIQGTECVFPPVDVNVSYTCPPGATVSGKECIPPIYEATEHLSCQSGQELVNGRCQAPSTQADQTLKCGPDQTLSGTLCYGSLGATYPADQSQSCPTGGALQGNQCVFASTAATASYSCIEPTDTLNGTQCVPPPYGATTYYTCPSLTDVLDEQTCTPPSTPAEVTYSCTDGSQVSGDMCIPFSKAECEWINTCGPYEERAGIAIGNPE
jgi:conjugal transfer mating pair stabilization protein TraN